MENVKHKTETFAFWTALLTFLTTLIDKVFSMLSKKDAAVVKADVPVFSVESSPAAEPFPWMSVLMWTALAVLVIIIVIKVQRASKDSNG